MMWTAIMVTLVVGLAVIAATRLHKANKTIERILVEELGAAVPIPPVMPRLEALQPNRTRRATDQLLGAEQN